MAAPAGVGLCPVRVRRNRFHLKEQSSLKNGADRKPVPRTSKLVSALTALEEPADRLDPRPGDGGGVRGGPGDLQRRQLFGQDLAVDAAGRGAEEPPAGEEDQGEARVPRFLYRGPWSTH